MNKTQDFEGKHMFGFAARCNTLPELIDFLGEIIGEEATRATIAYGMLLEIQNMKGNYRNNALEVLDKLSLTKAKLDSAACHTHPTIDVTGEILLKAQLYADELTIPCTEWPTAADIIENVLNTASNYCQVTKWEKTLKNKSGAVIGIEEIK